MSNGLGEAPDLYDAAILQRARAPRHAGRPEAFDGSAKGDNPLCGDRIEVFVALHQGRVDTAPQFVARGCAVSVASADLMAEAVVGCTPDAVRALAAVVTMMAETGVCPACAQSLRPLAPVHLYPSRRRCVTLPWRALLAALEHVENVA